MYEFKTLSRRDVDFSLYLLGKFSKTDRALPVQSLNIGSEEESVTFRIHPIADLKMPNIFKRYFEILKLKQSLMVLFPMFLVLIQALKAHAELNYNSFAAACAGALFLQFGLNLRNDFIDYVHGSDRNQIESINKPLQLGWLAAWQVQYLSWLCLAFSFLISLPVYFLQPQVIKLVLALVFIVVLSNSFLKSSYKYKLFHEFFLFLFLGPGLFFGLQLALGLEISPWLLLVSIVWGWLCIFFVYLKYFENIMPNAQFKKFNTIHWLGFERAKHFLIGNWYGFVALFSVYDFLFGLKLWSPIFTGLLILLSGPFVFRLGKLKSPLGSAQSELQKNWYHVFALIICCWFVRELVVWGLLG